MAVLSLFLLAVIGLFALIASVPLVADVWAGVKDEVRSGIPYAVPRLLLRGFVWLVAILLAGYLVLLGGIFIP